MLKPNSLSQRLEAIASKVEAQQVKIPIRHEGILEVPEGKDITSLGSGHFMKLIDKHGWPAISKALINLKVWNKNRNKALSTWADSMQAKLAKQVEKSREKKGATEERHAVEEQWSSDMQEVLDACYRIHDGLLDVQKKKRGWYDDMLLIRRALSNRDVRDEIGSSDLSEKALRDVVDRVESVDRKIDALEIGLKKLLQRY